MLFNSGVFLQFLAAFLLLYLLARKSLDARNWLIVLSSYVFYGWWDWRFLGLLLGSSLVDYFVGIALEKCPDAKRKRLLILSLAVNLGALGFFKYFGFFVESLQDALGYLGVESNLPILHVILPVGISFYTFQSLSYTIDVYRKRIQPTRNLGAFLAYIAFFPQLVAGPIERAANLLPQFLSTRTVTQSGLERGVWLIVWGMFKKVVLADNLGLLVDLVYEDPGVDGCVVALATVAFGFQIYCDFSGYSDIARGLAYLLGFELMLNFNLPYFAVTPQDFWRRWHISLSTWFRDYLYIPLGGSRCGRGTLYRNLLLTMLIAGLWHGAGWNFVLWGLWHGLWLCLFASLSLGKRMPPVLGWVLTTALVFYGWLLFRAQSFQHILELTSNLWLFEWPNWIGNYMINLIVFTTPLILMQIWQHRTNDPMPVLGRSSIMKAAVQALLVLLIVVFWDAAGTPFIYFQF